jgi:predicted permease
MPFSSAMTDLRFAIRQLLGSPGYAAVAILTLALGIGVNSALFSVADSMFMRARPGVWDASGLVWVSGIEANSDRMRRLAYPDFERVRAEVPVFSEVAGIIRMPFALSTPGEPVRVSGQLVSSDYFSLLRTRFAEGRGFGRAEDAAGTPVIVLSHHAWLTYFGADPAIIGRQAVVNGVPLTVIGVTEAGFNGPEHEEQHFGLWVPTALLPTLLPDLVPLLRSTDGGNVRTIARLAPGATEVEANAALERLAAVIASEDSERPDQWTLAVQDASAGVPPGNGREIAQLTALSVAVTGLVLLIACANVSNLLLARSLARRRELAIRLSIGASRGRLVRQLLTESVLLAAAASVLGVVLAAWSTDLLLATALPLPLEIAVDWRIFGFSVAMALVTGIAFGLVPALHATRREVAATIKDGSSGGDQKRSQLQGTFVVAQVALSLVLLVICGLFVRSLQQASRVDLGFDASPSVLAVSFDLGLQRYDSLRATAFLDALIARARALPGVEHVSVTNAVPLAEWSGSQVHLDPRESEAAADTGNAPRVTASYFVTRPGFFNTLGIPIVRGRDFTEADAPGALPVALVNQSFASRHLAGREPIGSRISVDGPAGPFLTIIGVSADAVTSGLRNGAPDAVFVAQRQRHYEMALTLLVRSRGEAALAGAPVRRLVHALDPDVAVHRVRTLDRVRDDALAEQRNGSAVIGIIGLLALGLATIGLYAVIMFGVRQRTREIGVRMALGARQRDVVRMFVDRGLRLTLLGVAIGVVLSIGATHSLRSMLYGISPTDVTTLGSVTVLFLIISTLACWLPSRRAALVDPVTAMRVE